MGYLGDSSSEFKRGFIPYICVTSEVGLPPPGNFDKKMQVSHLPVHVQYILK